MIILGIICLIIGFLLGLNILWVIGIVLVVAGLVVFAIGSATRRPVAGRRYWY